MNLHNIYILKLNKVSLCLILFCSKEYTFKIGIILLANIFKSNIGKGIRYSKTQLILLHIWLGSLWSFLVPFMTPCIEFSHKCVPTQYLGKALRTHSWYHQVLTVYIFHSIPSSHFLLAF